MPHKNVICLVVDRLHAGMLGPYGNTWIRTPQFNRLACESFTFDFAFIDTPELDGLYRGYWWGRSAARAAVAQQAVGLSLPQILTAAGWHTVLITDEIGVVERPEAADFAERLYVEPGDVEGLAEDLAETQLARLFGTVAEWLESPPEPFFVWVHARGMRGAWDAPFELRQQYADAEDPEPPTFAAVPNRWLAENYEPDELLGITHAYAGQVALLDDCVGALLDQLHDSPWGKSTLFSVLSARGFPLGEHRRVGATDEALYNELIQVPWLMRFPAGLGQLARSQALVRGADLPGTLLDWLALDRQRLAAGRASSLWGIVRGEEESLRDRLLLRGPHDRALRTPAWHLRVPASGSPELFAKPSDRWEVNEVSNRLPDIVSGLLAAIAELEQAGEDASLAPLDEALVTEVD